VLTIDSIIHNINNPIIGDKSTGSPGINLSCIFLPGDKKGSVKICINLVKELSFIYIHDRITSIIINNSIMENNKLKAFCNNIILSSNII